MKTKFCAVLLLALLTLAALSARDEAAAQSCGVTISDVNFGSINPADNTPYFTTGTLTVTCTGTPGHAIVACPNVQGSTPTMSDGAGDNLAYGLYRDNTYKTGLFTSSPLLTVPLNSSGRGSATRTVFAVIPAGQTKLPASSYTAGVADQFLYGDTTLATPCSLPATYSFQAIANVAAACTVSANTLDFGNVTTVAIAKTASTSISVNCPAGTSFTVGLSGGNAAATDPTARQMSNGSASLAYGLFTDSSMQTAWGGVLGTGGRLVSGVGGRDFFVYGKITAGALPPSGTYSDTVVVIVSY